MKQFRKSAAAAAIGLGTLALFATPGLTAGDHGAAKSGTPIQRVHMDQGRAGCLTGQPCQTGQRLQGMMGPGMMGPHMSGRAMMGYGMMGQQMGGRGMMGPGMMGPRMGGHGMMGPGMMGPHMGGRGMMGPGFGMGPGSQIAPSRDLTVDDVRHFLQHRLDMQGNKRLTLGEVTEADDDKIVAEITTVDGALVDRLEVDRHTGQMQRVE